VVERRASNFLLQPDGRCLLTGPGRTSAELAKFSIADADAHPARPMLGYADYRTPLKGFYMGFGSPSRQRRDGAPGHNAARTILRDFGSRIA
jgi:hypothetical protein